jgi:hypothetical protein
MDAASTLAGTGPSDAAWEASRLNTNGKKPVIAIRRPSSVFAH